MILQSVVILRNKDNIQYNYTYDTYLTLQYCNTQLPTVCGCSWSLLIRNISSPNRMNNITKNWKRVDFAVWLLPYIAKLHLASIRFWITLR